MKRQTKRYGYRFGVSPRVEDGFGHAWIQIREVVKTDLAKQVADCIRHGRDSSWYAKLCEKAIEADPDCGAIAWYAPHSSDCVEFTWQSNVSNGANSESDPRWYGIRCECLPVEWQAKIISKVAKIDKSRMDLTPADIIQAIPNCVGPIEYLDSCSYWGESSLDKLPFTKRQLEFYHANDPAGDLATV